MQIAAAEGLFQHFLDRLEMTGLWCSEHQPLIVALSGGPDSMALALIAQKVAIARNIAFEAVVIDHALRDNSAQEAASIQNQMQARDMDVKVLRICQPKPDTGIQEWARTHRLAHLASLARAKGACVLFAHHKDDQCETIALRLGRHSGLRGLSGIAPLRFYQGVLFARPFLSLTKEDLIGLCEQFGAQYIRDPSNQNVAFERVRWRQFLKADPQIADQLCQLARLSTRLTSSLDSAVQKWTAQNIKYHTRLWAECAYAPFASQPPAHQSHILLSMLGKCGGYRFAPASDAIDRLLKRLPEKKVGTLAGCRIKISGDQLIVEAEYGRKPADPIAIEAGNICLFDHRWMVQSALAGKVVRLGALTLSAKQRRELGLPAAFLSLPYSLQRMIPILQTLDARYLPPHLMTDRVTHGPEDITSQPSLPDIERHPFVIWPAPIDGPVDMTKGTKP